MSSLRRLLLRVVLAAGSVAVLTAGFCTWGSRSASHAQETAPLRVGFAETDVSPKLDGKPVYLAGFGKDRKATKNHDPIMARACVLSDGSRKIAMVSVDLIGFFQQSVDRIRAKAPSCDYIVVSSTHNHEGPDTVGLWGPGWFSTGVDPDYLKVVEAGILDAILKAEKNLVVADVVRIGQTKAPELLHDSRLPTVLHDDLVVLRFESKAGKHLGVVVQWNCHPETLSSKNTETSADFVAATVAHLAKTQGCPVLYLTGTVGGLMSSLKVEIKDENGKALADGTFEKTEEYGRMVGRVADKAIAAGKPIRLTPFEIRRKEVYLPLDNQAYILAFRLGMVTREAYQWKGTPNEADPIDKKATGKKLALRTELAYLKLGELEAACIPGEIYPELVLGKVQDPVDPGADFPEAKIEPSIYGQLKRPYKMLIGLANDEIGYIIPKRQWDEKPPFCYGLKRSQYGEINSVGPETAPILCEAWVELVKGKR